MSTQPEKKFKSGTMECAVWLREGTTKEGKSYAFRNVSFQVGYKDKNDEWQNKAVNLSKAQIADAIVLLQDVHRHLMYGGDE